MVKRSNWIEKPGEVQFVSSEELRAEELLVSELEKLDYEVDDFAKKAAHKQDEIVGLLMRDGNLVVATKRGLWREHSSGKFIEIPFFDHQVKHEYK